MKRTNQISDLKQSVARGFYVLREFNGAVDSCFKHLMKHSGNRSLSAIVIDLDAFKRIEKLSMRENKIIQCRLKLGDNLFRRSDEFLIDTQTMIVVIYFSGECHHAGEYPSSQLTAKHRVVLFATDKRTGMKTMPLKSNLCIGTFQSNYVGGDINGLIMKNHTDNVKTRFRIRETEISRFINKYTQRFRFHRQCVKKERVAGYKSNHSRGVLSPHPGDPFHREEIVANYIISQTLGQLWQNIFENGIKYSYSYKTSDGAYHENLLLQKNFADFADLA